MFTKQMTFLMTLNFALGFFTPMANAAAHNVRNPRAYAEKASRAFAEGDDYDSSGWAGCSEFSPGSALRFVCEGSRNVLVHGGHRTKVPYRCEFNFRQIGAREYQIDENDEFCE